MQMRSQKPLHVQVDAGHPFNRVVDPKRIIKKWSAKEEERHKRSLTPPPPKKSVNDEVRFVESQILEIILEISNSSFPS
jgi:hypothetical protein